MPTRPEKRKRPWKTEKLAHQRAIDMSWFYNDRRWRRFSKAYKQRHPLCCDCEDEGVSTPTQVTDHIVRYLDGGTGFDLDDLKDEDFKPRCKRHHDARSGRQAHGK
ncbi:hypothetical protein [Mesoflavibacter profundi]|uniref:hypothetical protein n=1 Tax=Mesoflavibacter profundi TaxID=2708110 RepID=UPI0035113D98